MRVWKLGFVLVFAMLLVVACGQKQEVKQEVTKNETFGEAITLTEVTTLQDMMANPNDYLGKEVLIEGKVNGRCMGSGCWVSLDLGNAERLIVASEDRSFIFSEKCVDSNVRVQGTLVLKNVEEHEEDHDHEHEDSVRDHECPDPEYFFAPKGIEIKA